MTYRDDFTIYAGGDFVRVYQYLDEGGDPVDLTGYTALAQARRSPNAPLAGQVIPTIDTETATITMSIPAAETSALTDEHYLWSMELSNASTGAKEVLTYGVVTIVKEIVK
jgi:hypothetical protein